MEKVEAKGTVRMIQSEAKLSGLPTDPYKALEISQSTRTFLHDVGDDEEMTEKNHESPHHNVFECSKVYLDLAQAEHSDQRLVNNKNQDHLVKNGNEKCIFLSGNEDLNNYTLKNSESEDPHTTENTGWYSSLQHLTSQLNVKIEVIKQCTGDSHIQALHDISSLVEQAWLMPTKDVAHSLCHTLREKQALDILIGNCASQNKELVIASGGLLEQILITKNRQKVVHYGLEILVKMAVDTKGEFDMARLCTGILENLFKISEEICRKLTVLGGLDVLLYWCRSDDRLTLRHCACGLANMALYCGPENQEEMAKHKVPEWLFPLAFNDNDSVRYYACLAISVLVANKEIESAVLQSGTLDLVLPFIASHSPSEFGRMDLSHCHGRGKECLKRLVPLLFSKREESEALAAFHFAMETGIKSLQKKNTNIFYEIGAISPLKRLANSPNATTSKLACEALRNIGENLPHKLTAQVPLWTVEDVKFWVSQNGFEEFAVNFEKCKVDGDLLLKLTEGDLSGSLHMKCRIARKRFMKKLKRLKITADYASLDPTKLDDFLMKVGSEFSQYTHSMLQAGVDMRYLPYLTEEQLINDCGISSGIHRSKILQKIRVLEEQKTEGDAGDIIDGRKVTDVFISYRRVNGSMLASLLKVFLQLRGFTVFLDIEKLNAGKFDEGLLSSVRSSRNFILVLTPNALDRCVGDKDKIDWLHKEIVAALESQCNIIPIMNNFKWPLVDQLPEDMKQIKLFNGIKWIHEYQDACVDKLERFMREEKLNNSMQGREPDFLLQKITEA